MTLRRTWFWLRLRFPMIWPNSGWRPKNFRQRGGGLLLHRSWHGIGDEFVRKGERCILIVPSALAPSENNWLLNPQHVGFRKIIVSGIEPLTYDPRMFAAHRRTHRKRQSS